MRKMMKSTLLIVCDAGGTEREGRGMMKDLVQQSRLNEAVLCEEFALVKTLNPSFRIDGDMWCVLHGPNLQDGVAGFGASPYEAVLDFNAVIYAKLQEATR